MAISVQVLIVVELDDGQQQLYAYTDLDHRCTSP
jgi:hypothetical protein